jgi:hypothetical protein
MEQAVARDDKSHFVFVMPVFTIKLRQHFIKPRRIGSNINYVSRDIAAARFQVVDFSGIRLKDLFYRCFEGDWMGGYPMFIIYATPSQVCGNRFAIFYSAVFIKQSHQSHRKLSSAFAFNNK